MKTEVFKLSDFMKATLGMSLENFENKNKDKKCRKPLVVVDIGCRWGFAERFLDPKYYDYFKIFGFDPDVDECERLQASYKDMPEGYLTCIPMALGSSCGNRNLYVTKEPACSSLYPPIKYLYDNYPALKCIEIDKILSINVSTLSDWALAWDLKSIDYMKIDTQGSELDILKGAGQYIDTTRCIDIEVEFNPMYEGQNLFWEVDQFLRSKGFSLWRLSNQVHYSQDDKPVELNDVNTVCFDLNIRQESAAYGGQLFWADARYISNKVFRHPSDNSCELEKCRDIDLFEALSMPDVVNKLKGI